MAREVCIPKALRGGAQARIVVRTGLILFHDGGWTDVKPDALIWARPAVAKAGIWPVLPLPPT